MRILICEDSVLLREGLVRLLEDAGHEVVAALPDTDGLMDAVVDTDPELCILDVRLPPTFTDEGIRAALAIRAGHPSLPLLVLSQYVEERYASDLIAAQSGSTQGGALGYLLKDRVADVAEFIESVQRIASGATVLDPEVVAQLLTAPDPPPPPLPSGEILTPREIELVRLVADGLSNLEIGERMHLSEPTIKTHMGHVLAKLGMRDRLQVAVWAHRSGTAR